VFLVFPLEHKPDWRRPPVVTLLIILINCAIWFGPQRADTKREQAAAGFYFDSGLAAIELPRYVAWVGRQTNAEHRKLKQQLEQIEPDAIATTRGLHALADADPDFRADLAADRIVRADAPEHAEWRDLRRRYDQKRGPDFTLRWASRPAHWQPESLITAAFLHGSTMHLVGNMIFLFVFGYTLEMTLGAPLYLLCYLLAGVGGEVGDLLARLGSNVPGLGASGAVAGLMAMYAVLHGKRRIRFFYQLLFYFDVVRAPAIILLPLWMGFELYAHFADTESGVANMAHFGGLTVGALLMLLIRQLRPKTEAPQRADAVPDAWQLRRTEARRLLEAMRYDDARRVFGELAAERPGDADAVGGYFNLARARPDLPDFHLAALRVFALPDRPEHADLLRRACADYLWLAAPRPLLKPEQLAKLALRLARHGEIAEARALLDLLAREHPAQAADAPVRLAIISALLRSGLAAEARGEAAALAERHPASAETRIADDLLRAAMR